MLKKKRRPDASFSSLHCTGRENRAEIREMRASGLAQMFVLVYQVCSLYQQLLAISRDCRHIVIKIK